MPHSRSIEVSASARLHFGLWAWGAGHERQFGGVGMMVREPRLRVLFRNATDFSATGLATQRVQTIVQRCAQFWGMPTRPACSIEVDQLPPQHAGFGVGTQLALAVAKGLAAWSGQASLSEQQLAVATGRGLRSAVGTYGFATGGLIVDRGKGPDDAIGDLHCRAEVPEAWRVLLLTPKAGRGKAGEAERSAFAQLPPVPLEVTGCLRSLAVDQIVPACQAADFDRFSAAVYEYGYTAGTCFEQVQGGPYATKQVTHLVNVLRDMGAGGVGQSSWGPTVFAFAPSERTASDWRRQLSDRIDADAFEIVVTSAANSGASLTVLDGQPSNDR